MTTKVVHLYAPIETIFDLSPRDAVIAAHAQLTMKDHNTWDYDKYAHLVTEGRMPVVCGDWCALQERNIAC
jgi:hypothetical protein